jgi:NAD(P)H-dependent FMN reductase
MIILNSSRAGPLARAAPSHNNGAVPLPLPRVVAVNGSLRAGSTNGALVRAAAELAASELDVVLFEGLGALPHFNPDLDAEGAIAPPAVAAWRAALAEARALILCTPEYAHGMPGVLKNALDWLVASGELDGKPVLLVTASPGGGAHTHAQLTEVLRTMSARVLEEASLRLQFVRSQLAGDGSVADAAVRAQLRRGLEGLVATLAAAPATVSS